MSGVAWTPDSVVRALSTFDDGAGSALYATGRFTLAGGTAVSALARWNGQTWDAAHGGLGNPPTDGVGTGAPAGNALQVHDDGNGSALWVSGYFGTAAGMPSYGIARLCSTPGSAECSGDMSGTACPCGNDSPAGQNVGCLSSLGVGGKLFANGDTSLTNDTLVLWGSQMPESFALYFQGTQMVAGGAGAAFGDGLRCVGGSIVRLATVQNLGGVSRYPSGSAQHVHARGLVTTPGTRSYQVWYRNAAAFCTPLTFNLTNAWTLAWTP